jgi:hypothetical protein
MVTGNYQEAEFYTTSYKNHKEKSKFKRKKRGGFLFFLVSYFKKEEGIIFVFL